MDRVAALQKAKEARARTPNKAPDIPGPLAPERAKELRDIADRLGRGKSLRTSFTWPGAELGFEMVVLSSIEMDEAMAAASRAIGQLFGVDDSQDVPVADLVDIRLRKQCLEVLWRAIHDPEHGGRAFKSSDELGRIATEDEIMILYSVYDDHKQQCDPDPGELTEQEAGVIMAAIKKKDSEQLRSIASDMPRRSLLTLVDQLVTSLTEKSSHTN